MTKGTIHAVDEDLFLVEGEWPSQPGVSRPSAAVLRADGRLYLLDSGSGPEQRSALHAVLLSFGTVDELVLVNSGGHPGLVGNNDLLHTAPARIRRHFRRSGHTHPNFTAGHSDYPPLRPTTVVGTELTEAADPISMTLGNQPWVGWTLDRRLVAIEATKRTGRLAFYLPDLRTLLLPDELSLTPRWPGSDPDDVPRMGRAVLQLIDHGCLDAVSVGFGGPLSADRARALIQELIDRCAARPDPAEAATVDDG